MTSTKSPLNLKYFRKSRPREIGPSEVLGRRRVKGVEGLLRVLGLVVLVGVVQAVATQRRTSLQPYGLGEGFLAPERHYSFHYGGGYQKYVRDSIEPFEDAYFDVRQDEIFYLVRRSKLDYERFKLVRYDMLTNTYATHPSSATEFITLPDYKVLAFTMTQFPVLELGRAWAMGKLLGRFGVNGILTTMPEIEQLNLQYLELDPVSGEVTKVRQIMDVKDMIPLKSEISSENHIKVKVDPVNSDIYIQVITKAWPNTDSCFLIKYRYKYHKTLLIRESIPRYPKKFQFLLMYPSLAQIDKTSTDATSKAEKIILTLNEETDTRLRDFQNSQLDSLNSLAVYDMVCIYVYDIQRFTLDWQTCYGAGQNVVLASSDIYNNKIYLLYQEVDKSSGTHQNIILQTIDFRTGLELNKKQYSGSDHSQPIFMTVNHVGVFVLANIEEGFKDLSSSDTYTTQNSNTNFAIILMDYDGNIVEIESYDKADSANDLGAKYPQRLIVGVQNKQQPVFVFLGSRDDKDNHQGGGVFITQPVNNSALFATGDTVAACIPVTSNCRLCSSNGCFKCSLGYKLQNGECKLTCDPKFFQVKDDTDDTLDIEICIPCHESCLTCSDPTQNGCLSCEADKTHDATKGTCECNQVGTNKYLGLNGACQSTCGDLLTGRYDKKCVKTCPENSDDYLQKIDTTNPRAKSTQTNCQSLTKHLKVQEGVTNIASFGSNLNMNYDLTATLWLKVTSTTNSEFTILSYGAILTTGLYNSTDSTIKIRLQVWDQESSSFTTNYTLSSTFALNEWVYIGVSMYKTNRIEYLYEVHMVTRTLSGIENQASYFSQAISLTCQKMYIPFDNFPSEFHDYYLGSIMTSSKFMFTGFYNKIMTYKNPMTAVELLDNALKLPVKNSKTYEPELLQDIIIYNDSTAEGISHREKMLEELYRYTITSGSINQTIMTLEDSLSDPLIFCQFHTIEKECNFMDLSQMYPVYLSESSFMTNPNLLYNGVSSISLHDGYLISGYLGLIKLCYNEPFEQQQNVWNHPNKPRALKFLYNATKEVFSIGSYLVETLVPKAYPDHGNSILHISESYSFEVTTRKYNLNKIEEKIEDSFDTEILAFALDCDSVQPTDVKISRQADGTFQTLDTALFTQTGSYKLCWKSPLLEYEAYIEASDSLWVVRENPVIYYNQTSFKLNQKLEKIPLVELYMLDDEFVVVEGATDCDVANKVGTIYPSYDLSALYLWFPDSSLSLHICWRRVTPSGYSSWVRLQNEQGAYSMTVTDRTATRQALAKISEFSHPIESNILPNESFWFKLETDGRTIDSIQIISNMTLVTQNKALNNENILHEVSVTCTPNSSTATCIINELTSIQDAYAERPFSIIFEYNKIAYTSGGSSYDFLVNETFIFSGVFTNPKMLVTSEIQIKGDHIKLGYQSFELMDLTMSALLALNTFVGRIWMDFRTTGCQTPTGSFRRLDKIDPYLHITNLDTKDCPDGTEIYADFIMTTLRWRFVQSQILNDTSKYQGTFNVNYKVPFIEQYKNLKIGTIGCNSKCKICAENDPNHCIICSDDYPYLILRENFCYELIKANFIIYSKRIEARVNQSSPLQNYTQHILVNYCPEGYFERDKQCLKCHSG